jgi:hypothetical protein
MPDDKIVSISKRLDDLEANDPMKDEGDLVITVVYEKSVITANGERSTAPVLYREEDYVTEDCGPAADGRGGRHLVRSPRPGAIPIEKASGNVVDWPTGPGTE